VLTFQPGFVVVKRFESLSRESQLRKVGAHNIQQVEMCLQSIRHIGRNTYIDNKYMQEGKRSIGKNVEIKLMYISTSHCGTLHHE